MEVTVINQFGKVQDAGHPVKMNYKTKSRHKDFPTTNYRLYVGGWYRVLYTNKEGKPHLYWAGKYVPAMVKLGNLSVTKLKV